MFTQIFNWLIARAPGFMRPAINWLVEGLQRITNFIAARWNGLGIVVTAWFWSVVYFKDRIGNLAQRIAEFGRWMRDRYIPAFVLQVANLVLRAANAAVAAVRALVVAGLATLQRWTRAAVNAVVSVITAVRRFAETWINRLRASIATLINALRPVLQGPAFLAEWLAGHMVKALLRFIFGQRERIVVWLTRESVAFTRWITREIETILLRWL